VAHLLLQGASVFPISSEGPPHSAAFNDTRGDVEDLLYNPDFHGFPISRLSRHTMECGGPILTRILTGPILGETVCKVCPSNQPKQRFRH
jgi:hypothetical protein